MLGKSSHWKRLAKRKGWECFLNTQQRVEQKFATLYSQVRAMLNGGKFTLSLQNQLWAEAAHMATVLQNNMVS